ncbi:MAG TPA: tagaturonate reductase [Parafilimonas sp.]|nr:tagaturonate reductase [Parafilimonas sp.]
MKLGKEAVVAGRFPGDFSIPEVRLFELPEKVLQFGTGVLLRGLPDFYIDKANKQNVFNGRIVVVKSTGLDVDGFAEQDGLYTQCIQGIINGNPVEEYVINASISKVLSARSNWNEILHYAESAGMQIILSNTTEVGIVLKKDDDIYAAPPESFPAKLLAFLYHRFQYFNGSEESGMVVIPTELIVDNGTKLKDIVLELAVINKLDKKFINWLTEANDFCNSLVDRIVPGALKKQAQKTFEERAGYTDKLTIMSEPYSLWAIESSSGKTKEILSFYKVDDSVIITPDINKYRELKLRLLNATHTFSCGLAFLAGFDLVVQSMQENYFSTFIKELMMEEIASCITGSAISMDEAISFAKTVIDRFGNPYIEHKWLSITMQYSAKIKMRTVPLLFAWYQRHHKIPVHMAAGFAAYILFMKPVVNEGNNYFGIHNGVKYKIEDDKAAYFYDVWQQHPGDKIVESILSDKNLWGDDLSLLNGFMATVQYFLNQFCRHEFKYVITRLSQGNKIQYEA